MSKESSSRANNKTKKIFFRKDKVLSAPDAVGIDYKDPDKLKSWQSNGGRILSGRVTGAARKNQREISNAIKKARILALLPYCIQ